MAMGRSAPVTLLALALAGCAPAERADDMPASCDLSGVDGVAMVGLVDGEPWTQSAVRWTSRDGGGILVTWQVDDLADDHGYAMADVDETGDGLFRLIRDDAFPIRVPLTCVETATAGCSGPPFVVFAPPDGQASDFLGASAFGRPGAWLLLTRLAPDDSENTFGLLEGCIAFDAGDPPITVQASFRARAET